MLRHSDFTNLYYLDGELFRDKRQKGIKAVGSHGYKQITINKKVYLVHRVVWFMHYNKWPSQLDHIDCNKLNNRIENLREVDHSINGLNDSKKRSNSKQKYRGVRLDKGGYAVRLGKKQLGVYDTPEEASTIYTKEKEKLINEKLEAKITLSKAAPF